MLSQHSYLPPHREDLLGARHPEALQEYSPLFLQNKVRRTYASVAPASQNRFRETNQHNAKLVKVIINTNYTNQYISAFTSELNIQQNQLNPTENDISLWRGKLALLGRKLSLWPPTQCDLRNQGTRSKSELTMRKHVLQSPGVHMSSRPVLDRKEVSELVNNCLREALSAQ